MIESMSNNIER